MDYEGLAPWKSFLLTRGGKLGVASVLKSFDDEEILVLSKATAADHFATASHKRHSKLRRRFEACGFTSTLDIQWTR